MFSLFESRMRSLLREAQQAQDLIISLPGGQEPRPSAAFEDSAEAFESLLGA